ncbi:MAG: acetate kinase [Sulfuricurvum sp.]|nr:acetate kinase [Sulfuricurvum sp.]
MKILVLNSGSSSIKYTLFDALKPLQHGIVENVTCYEEAIETILEKIGHVDAVGHRVVHGGEVYTKSVLIDSEVMRSIEALIPLAPLHNKANLAGIQAIAARYPHIKQVAVFDTAFHTTLPKPVYLYPIPYRFYEEFKIRRYGFHGTSHHYVAKEAAKILGKSIESLNAITLHLGNGASMCAIQNGLSVDTTMGFTPLEGLMMGTRCGDIDPAIVLYLEKEGFSGDALDEILNKESGLKGICGNYDMREIHEMMDNGDEYAQLALDMFTYRIKKYIGAYSAVLGRVDCIVFTGGIGEHESRVRLNACSDLENIGIVLDPVRNEYCVQESVQISTNESRVKILVIPTNEELEIAIQTKEAVGRHAKTG